MGGMPPASRTRWRLGPGLPFPGPNGGLVLRSHRCLPSSNRSGHARVDVPAWLGATLPNAIGIQVTQAPPAGHTTAVTQGLRQVFPWDACLQHEQNAIERCFISQGELTWEGVKAGITAFSRRHSSLLKCCLDMRARSINASG